MRSVDDADLTARARIRTAAVEYFGTHGVRASTVRAIATSAGVSPGLVIHHFGSKEGLRRACDEYVAERMRDAGRDAAENLGAGDFLAQLAQRPDLAPLMPYVLRVIVEGGEFGKRLFASILQDTDAYLRAAVAAGTVRPASDDRQRAQLLVLMSLGTQLLARYVVPTDNQQEAIRQLGERFSRTTLELFTNGLFAGTEYLDALLATQEKPVATQERPAS